MKLAVVGSINMDMTVTAERIPLKGETLRGDSLHYIPGGKGANQSVRNSGQWGTSYHCFDSLLLTGSSHLV